MAYSDIIVEGSKLFFGGIIGTIFTAWYKDFKAKKNDRKRMFLRMVEAKSYISIPQTLVSDLNMLPVLFRHKKKVLEKYKLYYADLCLPVEQVNLDNQKALYWDLLREMGNDVGYSNIDNHTLNSRYIPNAAMDEHIYQKDVREKILAYLKSGNDLQKTLIDLYETRLPAPAPPTEQP